MRFRGKSIRRKIVALLLVPLVSLTAIWAFATVITGREAMQLLDAADIVEDVGYPVEDAVHAIQKERKQALIYLADPSQSDALTVLHARQQETNQVIEKLNDNAGNEDTRDKMSEDARTQLSTILEKADGLENLRRQIDDRGISGLDAYAYYNGLIDLCYNFRSSLHAVPDADLDKQGRALVAMIRGREALAREDSLYTAALTAQRIDSATLRAMSDLIAERNLIQATNMPVLPGSEQKIFLTYRKTTAAPEGLRQAEDAIFKAGAANALKVMNQERWDKAAKPVLADLDRLNSDAMDRFQDRVEPEAESVLLQAGAAGILGFLALAASIFVSVRIGRTLIRDLTQLRKDAQEVATVRLPSVMRRLATGEQVDIETEAPRLSYGADEMGQVGQALNTVQRAAVEAAVKQAELRHGISEVFVNLARRSQVLLHRQLTLLDEMERRTEDTDELADLFRLDHMTTRMRRHAEGLVILSGAAPSRQWRKPIQLMDVVRAAVAEVEDYERIEVRRLPRLAVNGPAVADLTHLIAELLENATVFSPPHTAVQVLGERVANGFTLEIHDRGLGMAPDALLEANLRLSETPDFELSDTDRLGLFVVSRLAQRQGVKVSLQPSPYGGTTAVLLIPAKLLTDSGEPDGEDVTDEAEQAERDLPALGEIPAVLRERPMRTTPAPSDGPVEQDPPVTRFGQQVSAGVPQEALDDEDEDGGLFRGRGLTPTPPLPGVAPEQHQQVPDGQLPHHHVPAAVDGAPDSGPAPLPRRVPPKLVSDNGRRVGGQRSGRHAAPRRDEREQGWDPHAAQPAPPPAGPAQHPGWDHQPHAAQQPAQPSTPSWATPSAQTPATEEHTMPAQGAEPPRLPRRVRQASLAPQLKSDPAPQAEAERYPAETDPERDAEQARATMASLQRGWQRGRRQTSDPIGGQQQIAPGTNYEGDGR
ncbi:nitrate- and nitrite sensing domain-containing protein [Streptomyces pactum]|uniref:histidine kinase n=1 Tax=Streptomyces pactum TaxID=68249 RepID=A0ABS0NEZ7_9ACTN|nr:nitrate- and nitrite sensing domain-containing protein [Streptomyces pactum]MBH5333772.1 nitrate- and nitrite sensing domain-containing protein [Streptomyces pactum]